VFSPGHPCIGKVIDYVFFKALSLGTCFDMSDINMTNTFNVKSIKGGTGQPHYARWVMTVYSLKKRL